MNKNTIKALIRAIERERSSNVLVYFTNDLGKPFSTSIGGDTIPLIKNILKKDGPVERRTLILHTNGGHLEVVWPLVSLIKEYSKNFEVIIPSKALSAGTLISLGADKITMCKGAFLSPIDPTGSFQTNKNGSNQIKSCSVEDIMGFIAFSKEKIGIADQAALTETLKLIVHEWDPSIVGALNRTHSLIRSLAKKLMKIRKASARLNEKNIGQIAKYLIEELYSHQHLINFKEAKEIGISYTNQPNATQEEKILKLFEYYKKEMLLEEMGQEIDNKIRNATTTEEELKIIGATLHSKEIQYNFEFQCKIGVMPTETGATKPQISLTKQGWFKK